MVSSKAERAIAIQYVQQNIRHLSKAEAIHVARIVQVRDVNVREDVEDPPPPALIVGTHVSVNLDVLELDKLTEIQFIVERCLERLNRPAS